MRSCVRPVRLPPTAAYKDGISYRCRPYDMPWRHRGIEEPAIEGAHWIWAVMVVVPLSSPIVSPTATGFAMPVRSAPFPFA